MEPWIKQPSKVAPSVWLQDPEELVAGQRMGFQVDSAQEPDCLPRHAEVSGA
jgi:hypothetical protein